MSLKCLQLNILLVAFLLFMGFSSRGKAHNILVKFNVCNDYDRFLAVLDKYYDLLSHEVAVQFLITADGAENGLKLALESKLTKYPGCTFEKVPINLITEPFGAEKNLMTDFSMVLEASEAWVPCIMGWDKEIVRQMQISFPMLDGVLYFCAKEEYNDLDLLPIIGRNYLAEFVHIRHPSYSCICWRYELRNVSSMLKKASIIDRKIFCKVPQNEVETGSATGEHGICTRFFDRRSRNFDLAEQRLCMAHTKLWSILICTLEERREKFFHLKRKLLRQIKREGLEEHIEVISFCDNRERKVGYKRNLLIQESSGLYISFIDDDDDVSDDYIKANYEALRANPDCVELKGIVTFRGKNPKLFVHSNKYKSYFEKNNVYYRCPNHLNLIKRSIACQFLFPQLNRGEDTDWAIQLANSLLLKTAAPTKAPLYFYKFQKGKKRRKDTHPLRSST